MADTLLDSILEVVNVALNENDMSNEVAMVKDYSNFQLILKLKNWVKLSIGEESDMVEYQSGYEQKPSGLSTTVAQPRKIVSDDNLSLYSDTKKLTRFIFEIAPEKQKQAVADSESKEVHVLEGKKEVEEETAAEASVKESGAEKEDEDHEKENEVEKQDDDGNEKDDTDDLKIRKSRRQKTMPPKILDEKSLDSPGESSGESSDDDDDDDWTEEQEEEMGKKQNAGTMKTESGTGERGEKQKRVYRSSKDLLEYVTMINNSGKTYSCKICNYQCQQTSRFREHLRKHSGEKPYQCDSCEMQYASKSSLMTHHKRVHNNQVFSCRYCDFSRNTEGPVQLHERRMHLEPSTLMKCPHCPFKSRGEERFRYHLEGHDQNTSYICSLCGKIFISKKEMDVHRFSHKRRGQNVPCPACDKKFSCPEKMKAHLSVHSGIKKFKCRFCSYEFRIPQTLVKHHFRKHSGEPVFACEPCEFQTNSWMENKRHISTLTHMEKVKGHLPS